MTRTADSAPKLGAAAPGIRLDARTRRVSVLSGRAWKETPALSPKEFELLELFLRHSGYLLERRRLLEELWPKEVNIETVDRHVQSLRKKLGPRGARLKTARGRGYILG